MVEYICEKCGKVFKQKGHYIYHSTKRKRPCVGVVNEVKVCATEVTTQVKHSSPHSEGTNTKYQCPKCQKVNSNKYNLRRHMKMYCAFKSVTVDDACDMRLLTQSISDSEEAKNVNSLKLNSEGSDKKISENSELKDSINSVKSNDEPNGNLICEFCDRSFTRSDNLRRHMKQYCKHIPSTEDMINLFVDYKMQSQLSENESSPTSRQVIRQISQQIGPETTHTSNGNMPNMVSDAITDAMYEHNAQMVKYADRSLTKSSPKTNPRTKTSIEFKGMLNSGNSININNNFNLTPFGKEDLDALTDAECIKYLERGYCSIQIMARDLHFNPDRPEYHNVCITNTRASNACVYNGELWVERDKTRTLKTIYDTCEGFLIYKYDELKSHLKESARTKFERFKDECTEEAEREIKKDLCRLLYNKRYYATTNRKLMDKAKMEEHQAIRMLELANSAAVT